jgi:hypothetical protein
MGQFRHFLNAALLQEAHLNGRLFTWSSEREQPTLERIDRFFFSDEWAAIYPDHGLHSLSSLCSDHTPLLLHSADGCLAKKRFHFCAFWRRFSGFEEVVAQACHCPL